MGSYRFVISAVFLSVVFPTFQSYGEESPAQRLVGKSESEIQTYLEKTPFPFNEIRATEARAFFDELGDHSGFKFILGEDVKGDLRLENVKPLTYKAFLEETLAANGYTWRRQPGAPLIWITKDLATQRFPLSPGQRTHLESLSPKTPGRSQNEVLKLRILGTQRSQDLPSAPTRFEIRGPELIVTDTQSNLLKVKNYLDRHDPVESNPEFSPLDVRKADGYARGPARSSSGLRQVYQPRHRTPADLNSAVQGMVWYTVP